MCRSDPPRLRADHLLTLAQLRSTTVGEFARRVNVSKAAAMNTLSTLRKRGLVTWQPRKHRTVRLTPVGVECAALIAQLEVSRDNG